MIAVGFESGVAVLSGDNLPVNVIATEGWAVRACCARLEARGRAAMEDL